MRELPNRSTGPTPTYGAFASVRSHFAPAGVRVVAGAVATLLLVGCGGGEDDTTQSRIAPGESQEATAADAAPEPSDFSPERLTDEAVCDLASVVLPRLESEIGAAKVQPDNPVVLDDPELTPADFSMCSFDFEAHDGGSFSIAQLSNRAADKLLTSDSPDPCPTAAGSECIERVPNMFVLRTADQGAFMIQVYLYPPGYDSGSYDAYDEQVASEILAWFP